MSQESSREIREVFPHRKYTRSIFPAAQMHISVIGHQNSAWIALFSRIKTRTWEKNAILAHIASLSRATHRDKVTINFSRGNDGQPFTRGIDLIAPVSALPLALMILRINRILLNYISVARTCTYVRVRARAAIPVRSH